MKKQTVLISRVNEDESVEGYVMKHRTSIYVDPVQSSELSIGFFYVTLQKIIGIPEIKCVCIPSENEYYVVPYA